MFITIQKGKRNRQAGLAQGRQSMVLRPQDLRQVVEESFTDNPDLSIKLNGQQKRELETERDRAELGKWLDTSVRGGVSNSAMFTSTDRTIEQAFDDFTDAGFNPLLVTHAQGITYIIIIYNDVDKTIKRTRDETLSQVGSAHYRAERNAALPVLSHDTEIKFSDLDDADIIYDVKQEDDEESEEDSTEGVTARLLDEFVRATHSAKAAYRGSVMGDKTDLTADELMLSQPLRDALAKNTQIAYPISIIIAHMINNGLLLIEGDKNGDAKDITLHFYRSHLGVYTTEAPAVIFENTREILAGILIEVKRRTMRALHLKTQESLMKVGMYKSLNTIVNSTNTTELTKTSWNMIAAVTRMPEARIDNLIKRSTYAVPEPGDENIILTGNGSFDLKQDLFTTTRDGGFSPSHGFHFHPSNSNYVTVPSHQAQVIKNYIFSILTEGEDDKYAPNMRRMILEALTTRTSHLFSVIGPGASGKTTLLTNFLKALLEQATDIGYSQLMKGERFNRGNSLGNRTMTFIKEAKITGMADFKETVSSERVDIERKGKQLYTVASTSTVVMDSNHIPHINTSSVAEVRRLIVILTSSRHLDPTKKLPKAITEHDALKSHIIEKYGQSRYRDLLFSVLIDLARESFKESPDTDFYQNTIDMHDEYWGTLEDILQRLTRNDYEYDTEFGTMTRTHVRMEKTVQYITLREIDQYFKLTTGREYGAESLRSSINYLAAIKKSDEDLSRFPFKAIKVKGVDIVKGHVWNADEMNASSTTGGVSITELKNVVLEGDK